MEIRVNQTERRSWVEIDLEQIKLNYQIYRRLLPQGAEIMAVIKADAYGHGDVHIARCLSEQGCYLFAVSNIDEAVGLREAGIQGEILILGYTSPKFARILYSLHLTQTLVSEEYAEALAQTGYNVKCQFAIDTGMNRIGLDGEHTESCIATIRSYTYKLDVNGIFTHLCVADTNGEECKQFTLAQISRFKALVKGIEDLNLPFVHCFNSAGSMFYLPIGKNNELISKIVRLGIVLYGSKPNTTNILPEGIAPAITWKSVVSMVKEVYPGETLGYGRAFKVYRKSRIATITTGYADGLNRLLSNRGFVMINGKKASIVGKICMDQTMIDVTEISDVKMGTVITILGESGNLRYTADDMADDLDTIGYEIICNITKRVQRFYKIYGRICSI